MRMANLTVGERLALNPSIQLKHLNVPRLDFGVNSAGVLLSALETHLLKYALQDWNGQAGRRDGFHIAQVSETGQLWGGCRSGVVVHVPVQDEAMQERLRVGPVVEVLVPVSMLTNLDEAILSRTERILHGERLGEAFRERMAALRAKRPS